MAIITHMEDNRMKYHLFNKLQIGYADESGICSVDSQACAGRCASNAEQRKLF